uniref:Leucine rich repeat-containing protein n=1 Tax=Trepomonas sp. PC1 TaxID=1076344 RepID=A0A146KGN9_9EUKA|eukprot:JAP95627.1 hypothetical protein TPC1_11315 [Trepomonas sp. PC1]
MLHQQLEKVKVLCLTDCSLPNLDFMSQLLNLESLTLTNNCLSEIEILNEANLIRLQIFQNKVKKFSEMPHLKELYVCRCGLSNLNFLQNFKNLTRLNVEDNYICDIKGVLNCSKINAINLSNNFILTEQFRFLQYLPLERASHWDFKNNPTDSSIHAKLKNIQSYKNYDKQYEKEIQSFAMDELSVAIEKHNNTKRKYENRLGEQQQLKQSFINRLFYEIDQFSKISIDVPIDNEQ